MNKVTIEIRCVCDIPRRDYLGTVYDVSQMEELVIVFRNENGGEMAFAEFGNKWIDEDLLIFGETVDPVLYTADELFAHYFENPQVIRAHVDRQLAAMGLKLEI